MYCMNQDKKLTAAVKQKKRRWDLSPTKQLFQWLIEAATTSKLCPNSMNRFCKMTKVAVWDFFGMECREPGKRSLCYPESVNFAKDKVAQ